MFTLVAALQQKGALNIPEVSLRNPTSIAQLAGQPIWLRGTLAVMAGNLVEAAALDRAEEILVVAVHRDGNRPHEVRRSKTAARRGYWGTRTVGVRTLRHL